MLKFPQKFHSKSVLFSLILSSSFLFLVAGLIFATSEADIVYPVKELGNCKNEAECRTYCDKPQNLEPCLAFAEKHNLIPKEELKMAKKFLAAGSKGPGDCDSKQACETFCNDVNNINECLAYAEKNELMSGAELEEAKKVQAALAKGAQLPGGCRNKKDCDTYCNSSDHMEECIAFAEEAGFIPPDELEEAKKVLQAVKKGAKPPPCRGKKECDAYCAEPGNFEACITFAEAAGFVSAEEAAMARKTGGKGPGNCKGRDECEKFCEDENNLPVCIDFAIEHGLMSEKDAEMAKKTGGKGPGNCKGKDECEKFCQNPANEETCFNFAKEHDLISAEDLKMMEEGKQKLMEVLNQAPPAVMECLNDAWGRETVEKIKSGAGSPNRNMGDQIRECYGKMGPPQGEGGMPGMPPGEQPGSGPGEPGGPPSLDNIPPQVQDCLRSTVGSEVLENVKTGQAPPPPDFGEKMRSCFEQAAPPSHPESQESGSENMTPPVFPNGTPGGTMPPGEQGEQIEQLIQQQTQQKQQEVEQQIRQQMEQQIQQQMQQQFQQGIQPPPLMSPPPPMPSNETTPPQSLLRFLFGAVFHFLSGGPIFSE